MNHLSPSQRERYDQDGFLVIDSFLSPDEVASVRAGLARACASVSGATQDRRGFNFEKVGDAHLDQKAAVKRPGMLRKIQGAIFEVEEIRRVFCEGRMLDIMEDLLGPELYYHSSKAMLKPAHGGAPKPWHQDAAYWASYEAKQITVWIAIDDADETNGCVWAIPGSHKLGLIPHVAQELQVEESRIDLAKAQPVPVKSGGLLIFHSLVLHMSHRNDSDRNRWAIICDYDSNPNPSVDVPDGRRVVPLRGVPASAV